MAVLLTVMPTNGRMQVAVWVIAAGLTLLLLTGWLGGFNGQNLTWLLSSLTKGQTCAYLLIWSAKTKRRAKRSMTPLSIPTI